MQPKDAYGAPAIGYLRIAEGLSDLGVGGWKGKDSTTANTDILQGLGIAAVYPPGATAKDRAALKKKVGKEVLRSIFTSVFGEGNTGVF
jgi:hypothetical protein